MGRWSEEEIDKREKEAEEMTRRLQASMLMPMDAGQKRLDSIDRLLEEYEVGTLDKR